MTSFCGWLNLVERWFSELTIKMIAVACSTVDDLVAAIEEFLQAHNNDPRPSETATAESSLAKVQRGRIALKQIQTQS